MSIKTSQAILKCLIDLKSRVWFTLGSEDETVFCDTFSAWLPVKVFKTLNGRQSHVLSKFHKSKKNSAVLNYHISRDPDQTNRFCGISISCFRWSLVFGCSLLFSVQSMPWQPTFDVITSWPFIRPPRKTGGKSLHALVGSAASGAEVHFNIIFLTLWWKKKAFLYKVILTLRWCIEIISSFIRSFPLSGQRNLLWI